VSSFWCRQKVGRTGQSTPPGSHRLQAGSETRSPPSRLRSPTSCQSAFTIAYIHILVSTRYIERLLGCQRGNTGRGEEGVRRILAIELRAWLPGPKNCERPFNPKMAVRPTYPDTRIQYSSTVGHVDGHGRNYAGAQETS